MMKPQFLRSLGTCSLFAAAALMLSSCFDGDIDLDQFPTTPWGTAIINEMDTELPGTWILVREIVSANNQGLTVPFAGRTLVIQDDGVFREDYTTENHIDPNLRRHFSVEGQSGGQMRVEVVMDLDTPEDKPGYLFELLTRRDMSIGPKRKLNQMGEFRTSATSFPLGAGRVHTYADGKWVRCQYELVPNEANEYNELRISTMIGSHVSWIFRRKGTPKLAIELNPPTSEINIYSAAVMDQITEGNPPVQPETPEEEANALPGLGVGFFVEVLYPDAGSDVAYFYWVTDGTSIAQLKQRLSGVLPVDRQILLFGGVAQPGERTMLELGLEAPADVPGQPEGTFVLEESN